LGLNPFQYADDPFSAALEVHAILRSAAESWGVQLDETLRSALIVLSYRRTSLSELPKLLTNAAFRQACITGVSDVYVREFFARFDALSAEKQTQWVLPVLNKVSNFVAHPAIRA